MEIVRSLGQVVIARLLDRDSDKHRGSGAGVRAKLTDRDDNCGSDDLLSRGPAISVKR